jgi:hypothetical protein
LCCTASAFEISQSWAQTTGGKPGDRGWKGWQRKPQTFGSVEEALRDTARFYRKSLWADADCYARGWLGLR